MHPDNGGIDHLQRVVRGFAVAERRQHHVPDAGLGPASILPVNRVPVAELGRQVTPWHARARHIQQSAREAPLPSSKSSVESRVR